MLQSARSRALAALAGPAGMLSCFLLLGPSPGLQANSVTGPRPSIVAGNARTRGTGSIRLEPRVAPSGEALLDVPDPLAPGPYPTAVTEIDEGCSYDLDLAPHLFWTDPAFGYTVPEEVVFGDNDSSNSDVRCPGRPAKLVDMVVRVYYPGANGVVSSGGPFPLVVIMHGQQKFQIPGYQGYDYLGTLLASHGFIVASIDGRSLLDSTIKSRGEHIREHLRRFVSRNARGSGSFLEGRLDLSKVALIGHSRGGDAIAAAWEWQRVSPDAGYHIGALIALAPVQFFGKNDQEPSFTSHIRDVPYQILHGSMDGDVSDFQGLREYDWSADFRDVGETLKSMAFIRDANHNFFNTVWEAQEGDDYCCGGNLTGPVQRSIAQVYIHSLLEVAIHGDDRYRDYLTGELPDPVPDTEVALDFQAPGSQFTAIDHFEELPNETHDATLNSLEASVTVTPSSTAAQYAERLLSIANPPPWNSYHGNTWAGSIRWLETSYYASQLPAGWLEAFDPASPAFLSMRVGQVYRARNSVNPPGGDQTFEARLVDAHGGFSPWIPINAYAPIYPPWPTSEGGVKTVMSVVRIPVEAFSGVEVSAASRLELRFDLVKSGELVFDDLRLTR